MTLLFRHNVLIFRTLVLALLCLAAQGCGRSGEVEMPRDAAEAVERLDAVMDRAPEIDAAKRARVDSLKRSLEQASTPQERYNALEALFREYRSYSMDTLLMVSRQCVAQAREMGNDSLYYGACIMEAESNKGVGEYATAMAILDNIPPRWRAVYHRRMLNRYCSIYYSLADLANTAEERNYNARRLEDYRDSIIAISAPNTVDYWLNRAGNDLLHKQYDLCLQSLDSLEIMTGTSADPGVMAHTRAKAYEGLGDMEQAKRFFAIAAAYDLEHSVRKYEALQELARVLSDEGDNRRAYRYIMRAIDDIRSSHATSRIQRISTYLPIISESYSDAQNYSGQVKNVLLITSALLLAGFCIAIHYAFRKNKRLNLERHSLTVKNRELQKLRARLSAANAELQDSSKVKEQYLGYLFNLCAEYIGTFDKFRLQLTQRIKSGKVKDVESILSTPMGTDQLQSFFQKFDSIFLDIFPDFITKFNQLMQPGHELQPRQGELLSPELRIYALVRLGITDSTRIAAFLHYSPQTVYNYRFKVRSHARIAREEFPRAVKML